MSEDRFVRMNELVTIVGLAKSTIYELIANNKFPKPIHLTERTSVWRVSTVMNWVAEKEANKY